MKHYVGDPTRVRLQIGLDISAAVTQAICGIRPDGSTFIWQAAVVGTDEVVFDNPASRWSMPGTWRLWAEVTLPDRDAPYTGEAVIITIYRPGA